MQVPNWFRIFWWILITGLTAALFYARVPSIDPGTYPSEQMGAGSDTQKTDHYPT